MLQPDPRVPHLHATLAVILAVVALLVGVAPTNEVAATAGTRVPASPAPTQAAGGPIPISGRGTPVLDGAWSTGEWDRAGRHDFTMAVPSVLGGGTAKATMLVMNDDANVYLAFWVSTVGTCSVYQSFAFDSNGNGNLSSLYSDWVSAHVHPQADGGVRLLDMFLYPEGNVGFDTTVHDGYPPPGTVDGAAAGGHPGGTSTFAELSHPLDSADDVHDFSRTIGQSIRMVFSAAVHGGAGCSCEGTGCSTWTTQPAIGQFLVRFVPEDDVAPVMDAAPVMGSVVPSTLGEGSTRLAWSAQDPGGTGVDRYRVERQKDGGSWRTVAVTESTSMTLALLIGHRYRYRVTPRDQAGNWGAPAIGPAFTPALVQDRSSRVRYSSGWTQRASSGASGGTVHSTSRAGASATLTFTGYGVNWVTATGPGRGRVAIYVDGVRVTVIDLRTGTTRWRRIRFSADWMDAGVHSIRVKSLDAGKRVELDAFVVYR